MARGGARQGKPGTQHLNRTDLNVVKLPAVAAPGQTYGQAGEQLAAQQAVPMGAQPTPASNPAPPVTPGSLGPLTAPTARPDEPLTAGAPFGPGPSPAPVSPVAAKFTSTRDLIQGLAQTASSPALDTLAAYARTSL